MRRGCAAHHKALSAAVAARAADTVERELKVACQLELPPSCGNVAAETGGQELSLPSFLLRTVRASDT
jgi:hypothetical protein